MAAKVLKGETTADQMAYEVIEGSSLYVNSEAMAKLGLTFRVPERQGRRKPPPEHDTQKASMRRAERPPYGIFSIWSCYHDHCPWNF